jgi:hypothetical protein
MKHSRRGNDMKKVLDLLTPAVLLCIEGAVIAVLSTVL